jgi:hypothetical protein
MSQVTEISKEDIGTIIPLSDYLNWDDSTSQIYYNGSTGGANTQKFFDDYNISQKQLVDLFTVLKQEEEKAWNDATLDDGTDIRYVAVGEASIVVTPQKMEQSIEAKLKTDKDVVKDNLDISNAKTKMVFIVKYTTRTVTFYQSLAVIAAQVMVSSQILKLLCRGLTKLFIALVNRALGLATITTVEAAMQELGRTQGNKALKFVGWAHGATKGAKIFRFFGKSAAFLGITLLVDKLYTEVIHREYELNVYLLNLTEEDWKVKVLYSYNVAGIDKESTEKKELELPKVVEEGGRVKIPGVPSTATSKNRQVSYGQYVFCNEDTHLKGCGVLIEIINENQNQEIKNVLYKLEIPRFGNNTVNLMINEKDGYKPEEVYNKADKGELQLKSERGKISVIHAYNALKGAENNKYIAFLTIVDTEKFPKYKNK